MLIDQICHLLHVDNAFATTFLDTVAKDSSNSHITAQGMYDAEG